MLHRILAAMSAQNAPALAVQRTATALRGQPLNFNSQPYLVVSYDPDLPWGPVGIDAESCFDRERFFVLDLRTIDC